MLAMRALLIVILMAVVSSCSPAPVAVAVAPAGPKTPDTTTATDPTNNVINYACQTAADCAIKDVGSCCGYTPSCVNVDSPTFAVEVRADCEREGRSGVCGFRDVASCACVESRCTSIYAGDAGLPVN